MDGTDSDQENATSVLLYGAYGYTGRLVATELVERGHDPIVAGRNERRVARLGRRLGCGWRAFEVEEAPVGQLGDVDVLLNCAGPFVDTAPPLVDACLDAGTHYLDITGELEVFEAIAERDRAAERSGICLLPGVGFDVVPTDCLAARLKRRLPEADSLRLGVDYAGPLSAGTIRTLIEHAADGGWLRRNGALVPVSPAWNRRIIDFGNGPTPAVTVPLGDVSTAYYTTGIGNVETYVSVPPGAIGAMRIGSALSPLLSLDPVKRGLQWGIDVVDPGPTATEREHNVAHVWGEASTEGATVTERLVTPEPYALTVDAAATAVERVLVDQPTGFETPSVAFGEEFVLTLDRVERLN